MPEILSNNNRLNYIKRSCSAAIMAEWGLKFAGFQLLAEEPDLFLNGAVLF